jgi:hypothetical protein
VADDRGQSKADERDQARVRARQQPRASRFRPISMRIVVDLPAA